MNTDIIVYIAKFLPSHRKRAVCACSNCAQPDLNCSCDYYVEQQRDNTYRSIRTVNKELYERLPTTHFNEAIGITRIIFALRKPFTQDIWFPKNKSDTQTTPEEIHEIYAKYLDKYMTAIKTY